MGEVGGGSAPAVFVSGGIASGDGGGLHHGYGYGSRAALGLLYGKLHQVAGAQGPAAGHAAAMDVNIRVAGAHDEAVLLAPVVPFDEAAFAACCGEEHSTCGA